MSKKPTEDDPAKFLPPWFTDPRNTDCKTVFQGQKKVVHNFKVIEIVDDSQIIVIREFKWVLWEGYQRTIMSESVDDKLNCVRIWE